METIEIHLDCVDSTQEYAKKNYLSFPDNKITCITANQQTMGKGSLQKKWVSPIGNLYATFYFQLPLPVKYLTTLAQVMASSCTSVLLNQKLNPKMKWPNDIQLNQKKVAGILCETIFNKDSIYLFLGIGINVNMEADELSQIDQPSTSLKEETKLTWNIKKLLKQLQVQFEKDLELFIKEAYEPFRKKLNTILAFKGETVHCIEGQTEWIGLCDSLSKEGGLNLLLENNRGQSTSPTVYTLTQGRLIFREKSL